MDLRALGSLAIPVAATIVGGLVAAFLRPVGRLKSHAQHFAAGVVLAAVAVEVIPELERGRGPAWPLLVAFGVGGALMYALKCVEHRREHVEKKGASPLGMIVAAGADIFVDGLVVGAGIAKSPSTGVLLAVGLSIELLFLGVSIASGFANETAKWKPILTTAALAGVFSAGASGGIAVLRSLPSVWTNIALAFGSAAMLYLVTEELLVEAHEESDSPSAVASTFSGFLCFWMLEVVI